MTAAKFARAALVATGAAVLVAAQNLPAVAIAPVTTPVNGTLNLVTTDLCAFPISIHSTASGTERDYFNAAGQIVRIDFNFVEQDVFAANGQTLIGVPFVNEQHYIVSGGQFVHDYEVGVIERVPLPDGSTFLSAGRIDFIPHGATFAITPDVGHSGNLAEFCAALAG